MVFVSAQSRFETVRALAVALSQGAILHLVDTSGASFTAGPYKTACGECSWALFLDPGGRLVPCADAYEAAELAFAIASPTTLQERLEQLRAA